MLGALARKFFGSANDRRIKGYQARVDAINKLEPEIAALSTTRSRHDLQQLAEARPSRYLVPASFARPPSAPCRATCAADRRMVLHEGDIAEMKPASKTLVAMLPVAPMRSRARAFMS